MLAAKGKNSFLLRLNKEEKAQPIKLRRKTILENGQPLFTLRVARDALY